ncbi:glycosyltransferase [Budviciaceae bacterium CWB-B4]|uniref:Glycosyltransferase n=1 Tax=Limnobaculum xujianqingii TaxID=2738837 RepID=A0A9D7AL97_9GAMM|nr:glycosyltransferase [Limnobaculum xujianqingii]MBK5074422.1 glycosyltransferase [Limnobaculum xujianqingii]MBK5177912.1 glycosyltransferase [Limnobaculum xujianqingii]
MKILHVVTGFPYDYSGGITNYVRALVDAQIKLGFDVSVLAGIGGNEYDYVYQMKSTKINPFSLKLEVEDTIYEQDVLTLLKKFDLIHFHMVIDFPSNLLLMISKEIKKYVISLHDYFLICPRIFMSDYQNKICHLIDVKKCNNCCGVLDRNDFLRKISNKIGVALPRIINNTPEIRLGKIKKFVENAKLIFPVSNKVCEIYNNIIPSNNYIVNHIGNITSNMPIPSKVKQDGKVIVGLLGTLSYIKGAEVLVNILSLLKKDNINNLEFHFYGRADKKWLDKLVSLGLIYKGTYTQNDLINVVSSIDIGFVSPIWEDNAPQVVMEFLNLGTPVIGSRRGGITDFIEHMVNGYLFEPTDSFEFNEMIAWLKNITLDDVSKLADGIHKLKTPEQHAREIVQYYGTIKD